jgi:hypothetical protein
VSRSNARFHRSTPERALAWLVTGPLGHLYSFVTEVVVLWARYLASRLRGRA